MYFFKKRRWTGVMVLCLCMDVRDAIYRSEERKKIPVTGGNHVIFVILPSPHLPF